MVAFYYVRNDIKLSQAEAITGNSRCRTPKSKRRGERIMNRDFLESQGLEKETIDAIMAEYGKSIGSTKEQLESVTTEKKKLAEQVESLNSALTETNEKYANFDEQLNNATKELEESKIQNTKFRIANEKGIPLDIVEALSGNTEEEFLENVEKVSGHVGKRTTLPLGTTEPKDIDDEDAGLIKMLDNLTNQN